nr:hypothetical protein [Ruegeria arenilitoris]
MTQFKGDQEQEQTHAFASITAPSPRAAATDHISEPVLISEARAKPDLRPEAMDVPATARVAGPGLTEEISAAMSISGRFISRGIDFPH